MHHNIILNIILFLPTLPGKNCDRIVMVITINYACKNVRTYLLLWAGALRKTSKRRSSWRRSVRYLSAVCACLQIRPVRQSAASGTLYALYVKYNNNEKRIIKTHVTNVICTCVVRAFHRQRSNQIPNLYPRAALLRTEWTWTTPLRVLAVDTILCMFNISSYNNII